MQSLSIVCRKYQLQTTPTSGLGPAYATPTSIFIIIIK